ncbi:MAG: 3-hydroxy acid dehydrogenase/malonic semialdehyde reductase [Flavobacteriales bacterium]|jgi:3-hydroxy acid dehydrogenase/malonic semialdehyde reductase
MKMNLTGRIALITGATSGIGAATARRMSGLGMKIIACGRRVEKLASLKAELGEENVLTLQFDVRNENEVNQALNHLPEAWRNIFLLVNNAGNAHGLGSIQDGDTVDWDTMIDVNVKGLLYVSKCILPGMIERNTGHIVNIGSIAGKEVYPNGGVYCASKHAVDAINKGMRLDLNPYEIRVSAIHPGLVETEFSLVRFKGDAERSESVYQGYSPLQADDIADTLEFMVTRPAHVNVADVLILPTAQAASTTVRKSI